MTAGVECVGFADCPCRGCHDTRLRVTGEHDPDAPGGGHHPGARAYCARCRQAESERFRVRPALPWPGRNWRTR